MEEQVYLNGTYIPKANANISIMDRGFLFGDGVYELIPLYGKKIFLLDKHLKRLENSLNLIGMKNSGFDINNIENIIKTLIEKNKYENYFFYIHITRGIQNTRQHIYQKNLKPTVLIMGENYSVFDKGEISKGFQASIQSDFRWTKSNIKSISLLGSVLLKNYASQHGFYETLLIRDNKLTEGSASNVFVVKDNKIFTPKLSVDLLPGVTRDLLINLLRQNNLDVFEEDVTESDLKIADEVWCCSSTNFVAPIIQIDDLTINNGVVGNIALKAYDLVRDFIAGY
tara:strand:- start:498 stop:1349 length:852 start_codon:yes stop_codon:yes gene_type:complete